MENLSKYFIIFEFVLLLLKIFLTEPQSSSIVASTQPSRPRKTQKSAHWPSNPRHLATTTTSPCCPPPSACQGASGSTTWRHCMTGFTPTIPSSGRNITRGKCCHRAEIMFLGFWRIVQIIGLKADFMAVPWKVLGMIFIYFYCLWFFSLFVFFFYVFLHDSWFVILLFWAESYLCWTFFRCLWINFLFFCCVD